MQPALPTDNLHYRVSGEIQPNTAWRAAVLLTLCLLAGRLQGGLAAGIAISECCHAAPPLQVLGTAAGSRHQRTCWCACRHLLGLGTAHTSFTHAVLC